MSEYIVTGSPKQEELKRLIRDLHGGLSLEAARKRFAAMIKDVSAEEIAAMEQSLLDEGFPVEEVQRLCDVHAAVFQKALERPRLFGGGASARAARMAGHPVHSYKEENREAKRIIKDAKALLKRATATGATAGDWAALCAMLDRLADYRLHLERKENQLFPWLEQKGFTAPSKVMWAKDDEIRADLSRAMEACSLKDAAAAKESCRRLFADIISMIFKEEKILFPAALRKLTEAEWGRMRRGEEEIGWAWIEPGSAWDAALAIKTAKAKAQPPSAGYGKASSGSAGAAGPVGAASGAGAIPLSVGTLLPGQIDLMLKALPVDVTFVDADDKVAYYSGSEHRVFPRSPAIIGRDVRNCHPPKSVHIVEKIVQAFKDKKKSVAEFWIEMGGKFIHIRYFPVYGTDGSYQGTIEVSQDCTAIRALEGQRRLLDWED